MHLNAADFRQAIAFVKPAVRSKSPLPILEHIRVRSDGAQLIVTACSVDSELSYRTPAQGEAFDIALHARTLQPMLANIADGDMEMSVAKRCVIRAGGARYQLPFLPGEEMPEILEQGEPTASGDYAPLRDAIEFVQFAAAHIGGPGGTSNPAYCGVSLRCVLDALEVTATTGLLFAQQSIRFKDPPPAFELIVPTASVPAALSEGFLRYEVRPALLTLRGERGRARLKPMDYKFPDASRLVTQEKAGGVTCETAQLKLALQAIASVGGRTSYCRCTSDGERLQLQLVGDDGEADYTLPAKGDKAEWGMNMGQFMAMAERAADSAEWYWDTERRTLRTRSPDRFMMASTANV